MLSLRNANNKVTNVILQMFSEGIINLQITYTFCIFKNFYFLFMCMSVYLWVYVHHLYAGAQESVNNLEL